MKKFVIIDGNNICFRSFYALPMLQNFDGVISNAVFGFANTLVKIIEEQKPDYIAVAFDKGKKTFRHQMYKEYKMQRRPTPKELIDQFPLLREMLKTMHIKYIELDDIEADDIIGVLSRKYDTKNLIVSADKDVLQLIDDNTSVYAPQKGGEPIIYDKAKLKEVFGIEPYQIIELKGLMGDSSDNIPGVEGIGEKTALSLIAKYTDIDGVYANLDALSAKQAERLVKDKEMAYFSKTLATIKTDYPLDKKLEDFTYDYPFGEETLEFFKKYQFNSLLRKEGVFAAVTEENKEATKTVEIAILSEDADVFNAIEDIVKWQELYIHLDDDIFSFSDGDKEYNFAISPTMLGKFTPIEQILGRVKHMISDDTTPVYLYDAKDFMHKMLPYGIEVKNIAFDCIVAKYLVNSNLKTVPFVNAVDYFNLPIGHKAKNVALMTNILKGKLKEWDLEKLYYDIELPLIYVLFDMEKVGVRIDAKELEVLDSKYQEILSGLTEDIYALAGTQFNLNSPKQLGEILFGTLHLKARANKKESTNQQVLNELVGQHPIVQKILDYRQYYKLYSTYIKTYSELKDDNNRVHTLFNQTMTATGRLSSTDPNLQNIPTRSNEAKILRKIFIPSNPDGYLVSADYSQIELRLLANFSGDEKLIKAYNEGEDIHALTASEIFGVPIDMVTENMRRNAKAINFGIIYGISDWGLSQNIGIMKNEAKVYINKYFEKYPSIEKYMNDNVAYAKEHGYIKSVMGRIRFIPELKGTKMQQLFGERVAMNMPLQGSASDVIKLAMIKVYQEFNNRHLRSKLVLQIHDELIVDAVKEEVEIVEKILKACMENVIDTKVKLLVNVGSGTNLSEAK